MGEIVHFVSRRSTPKMGKAGARNPETRRFRVIKRRKDTLFRKKGVIIDQGSPRDTLCRFSKTLSFGNGI